MSSFISASKSDVGVVRSNNEDFCMAYPEKNVWLLADGVGGHDAGEVASELACKTILEQIETNHSIEESILTAHQTILDAPNHGKGKAGMATTIVVVAMDDDCCRISWVGDSRAYLIDKDHCEQLTVDHSLVQKLIESGNITAAEAATHPSKHVVYQVLGMPRCLYPKSGQHQPCASQ